MSAIAVPSQPLAPSFINTSTSPKYEPETYRLKG